MRYDWTEEELALTFALHEAGRSPEFIAATLRNKTWRSVAAKIREGNRRGKTPPKLKRRRYKGARKAGISKVIAVQQPGEVPVTLPFTSGLVGDVTELTDI